MLYTGYYQSPLGRLLLAADEIGLTGLWFERQRYFAQGLAPVHTDEETPILAQTRRWLDLYFSGSVPDFTPPLHPVGSDPAGGVGAAAADPLRKNHDLRRTCRPVGRKARPAQDVRAGGGRCCRAQPDLDHHTLPPCCRGRWQPDRVCGRAGYKGPPACRGGRSNRGKPAAHTV